MNREAQQSLWTTAVAAGEAARVRVQIFPLAADPEKLTDLCNQWFNEKVPNAISVVRPVVPVVFCGVLSYDDTGPAFKWNTGVVAQNEMYFLVALERYRLEGGRLRFVEYGIFTPYIFVDSAESVLLGRSQYGFPKEVCVFRAGGAEGGIPGVAYGSDVLSVDTWQPTPLGHALQNLLTISKVPRFVDDGFDPVSPLNARPGSRGRSDVLWWLRTIFGELRTRGHVQALTALPRLAQGLAQALTEGISVNCYNLRQVPHYRSFEHTLYRDLVNFRMKLRGVQNLRFFEETSPGGAYSLAIRRTGILPIVERLGLRVIRKTVVPTEEGNQIFEVVDAIAPFYTQVDIVLEGSRRLAWQHEFLPWSDEDGREIDGSPSDGSHPLFDDYLGASPGLLAIRPAPTPPSDYKFMMLAGRKANVSEFLRTQIPADCPVSIEPVHCGDYVPIRSLWRRSRSRTAGQISGVAWQGGRYLSFSIPVTYRLGTTTQRALFLVNDFTDNPFTVQMSQFVFGIGTHQGWFVGAGGDWFETTQHAIQLQVLDTTILRRNATEARFERQRWLDVIEDCKGLSANRAIPVPELQALFYDEVAGIRATLLMGGVPDPSTSEYWVARRLTLVDYEASWSVEPRPPAEAGRHWLRMLPADDYPLVEDLGLLTEPELPFDLAVEQDFPRGALYTIPVLAVAEGAATVRARRLEVLWNQRGRSRRVHSGAGFGMSRSRGKR